MSKDIKNILRDWDYDPDSLSVRIITGDDGRDKIQLRIDMGLLQMEFDARPDGHQIQGHETWLKRFEHQQKEQTQTNPDGTPFELSTEDCDLLLSEGVQFYHRYLSFWHLELFDLCARDTLRNLRLFSFVRKYAKNEADKLRFDQWRPYVLMMHARSLSAPLVRSEDYIGALQAIDSGIAAINNFLEEYDHSSKSDHLPELIELRGIRAEVIRLLEHGSPDSLQAKLYRLSKELEEAVAEERFENAAQLRDELELLQAESANQKGVNQKSKNQEEASTEE